MMHTFALVYAPHANMYILKPSRDRQDASLLLQETLHSCARHSLWRRQDSRRNTTNNIFSNRLGNPVGQQALLHITQLEQKLCAPWGPIEDHLAFQVLL
jgi:hypothetical protein